MYLSLGIKLSKIQRILNFKQSDWLKKDIDIDTDKRKNAVSSFEKDFFKLMNNSVFGKTMENLRKRISVKQIIILKIMLDVQANQILFHRKYLVKILLLFIKQNQF